MARRSAQNHAHFILPHLQDGMKLLDCGCGPGTISRDLALRIPNGSVTGLDGSEKQIAEARRMHKEVHNLNFQTGIVYDLPFDNGVIDFVFAHALFEHLSNPNAALSEIYRVLKPGGILGICSPDFAAFVLSPTSDALENALGYYRNLQESNGGNTLAGRCLLNWVSEFPLNILSTGGRCENYEDPTSIGEYLAEQLVAHNSNHAATFQTWQSQPGALFAQMWIYVIARKPL